MLIDVLDHLRKDQPNALERLCDLLRIKSVSTDPAHAPDCLMAAEWVAHELKSCGLETKICSTSHHPVVWGRTRHFRKGLPHVLFYGHYDVQPPDPLDKWTTPPFWPTIRDGKLFARGASDDKGQVMCFIEAIRAWHAKAGGLPVNVSVVIEGDEECGSEPMADFVDANKDALKADVALVSDTSMWDNGQPAICYGLRGLLYFDIQLHGPGRDLHSGVYGGAVANPATELMLVLGRLFDSDHRVTIPGFYDDVPPLSDEESKRWEDLNFDEKAFAKSVGLTALHGEAGCSTLQRRWARPSCDVNGLYGGYMGHGAKTVIPSFAGAKISFRLAANQDPHKISSAFTVWLHQQTPPGCRWRIEPFGSAYPVAVATDSPHLAAAQRAVAKAAGKPPVLIREGATIPVVSTFKTVLGIDTLLVGFGLNDDNLHSPNEKFDLDNFHLGCLSHAAILDELSRVK